MILSIGLLTLNLFESKLGFFCINAVSLLASYDGVFASPTGASSIAGLIELVESNLIQHDENVVCIVTMIITKIGTYHDAISELNSNKSKNSR